MYKQITECRICGNANLVRVLDLGDQVLTGVFPSTPQAAITKGPLHLVKCSGDGDCCGLLQLEHTYDLAEMYGENYGYRSGLNPSMVRHLHAKVDKIQESVTIEPGDLIIDIGSNDSTTLQGYSSRDITLVGIDPTGVKFHAYYPEHIDLIPDFFSASLVQERFKGKKAKVVTSFSMFYDLESPMDFMRDIHAVLADDGIWVFEQSYMPTMLDMNSYDTVCHEHLEYYSLHQIKWMTDRVGLRIIAVEFNDVNGGSFSITVTKAEPFAPVPPDVAAVLEREIALGLHTLAPYRAFAMRVEKTRKQLREFLDTAKAADQTVVALGASTKGNVLLQYCGITRDDIACVGEVNADKFGCFTPGTWLPIVPEEAALEMNPDYLIILPWHFGKFFLANEKFKGLNLVTPLPEVKLL
jgi:hypothetical protein